MPVVRRVVACSLAVALCACGTTPPRSTGTVPRPSARTTPAIDVYAADTPTNFAPAARGLVPRVYVPNVKSNTIVVIDPTTFKIVAHYPVGKEPQHITPSWDLSALYVDQGDTGILTEIAPATGRVARVIRNVTDPYNLYFSPDGTRAIVVAEDKQRLDFRDPKTWKLEASVVVPWRGVDHGDFTADGRYFVATTEFSGMVVQVNVRDASIVRKTVVGGKPIDVRLSPDGTKFFIANQGWNGVSIVDARTLKELKRIKTGNGAHGLAVSRDERFMYLTNRMAGTISVLDARTGALRKTWKVGGTPDMMSVSPDGSQLWFSNRFSGYVTVVRTTDGHVLAKIPTGNEPHGLCYWPQPGRYSTGHNGVMR
jgi:YVTN family beta-propeller protein